MLRDLPFVPESVWREVQVNGDTPGTITLTFDPARPPLHYRIELEPRHTHVHVRAIDLDIDDISGRLVIDDTVVRLHDVTGLVGGGRVATEAALDFGGAVTHLDIARLQADGVALERLPRSWGLPRDLTGRLAAEVAAHLDNADGKVRGRGTGTGQLRDLRVAGVSIPEPVRLTLRDRSADGKEPPTLLVEGRVQGLSLAELAAQLAERPKVALSGRLAAQGQLVLPLDTIGDPATYRGGGTVEIAQARLETVSLDRLRAEVAYRDGNLRVAGISTEGADVSLTGAAEVALAPAGDLRLDLTLRRLNLAALGEYLKTPEPLRGAVNGTLGARVPVKRWDKIDAWHGDAALSVPRAEFGELTVRQGAARAELRGGRLTLTEARASIEDADVVASGRVELTEPYPLQGKLEVRAANLALLRRLPAAWRPPQLVGGRLSVFADVKGSLRPWLLQTNGRAAAIDLEYVKLRAPRVALRWRSDGDRLSVDDLDGTLAQGRVTGSALLPLRGAVAGRVDLQVQDVDAAALGRSLWEQPPVALAGRLSGVVTATLAPEEDGRRAGKLTVELPKATLRVEGVAVEQLQGTLDWRQPLVTYHLDGRAAGGLLHLDGQLETGAKVTGSGRLRVEKMSLSRLSGAFRNQLGEPILHGRLEVDLPFEHNGGGPLGVGRFAVTRLGIGDGDLRGEVRGDLQLLKEELLVREVSGELADGTLRQAGLALPAAGAALVPADAEPRGGGETIEPVAVRRGSAAGPAGVADRRQAGSHLAGHGGGAAAGRQGTGRRGQRMAAAGDLGVRAGDGPGPGQDLRDQRLPGRRPRHRLGDPDGGRGGAAARQDAVHQRRSGAGAGRPRGRRPAGRWQGERQGRIRLGGSAQRQQPDRPAGRDPGADEVAGPAGVQAGAGAGGRGAIRDVPQGDSAGAAGR